MSEYCSQCSPFESTGQYDYDLFKMALKVKRGRSISFICEGCSNRAIYKDETGEMVFYTVNLDEL